MSFTALQQKKKKKFNLLGDCKIPQLFPQGLLTPITRRGLSKLIIQEGPITIANEIDAILFPMPSPLIM